MSDESHTEKLVRHAKLAAKDRESPGISKPQRWDIPFWKEGYHADSSRCISEEELEHVLQHEPFSRIDPERFSKTVSLNGILQNDARVKRYKKGEIIVRQGDYGNSAFLILSGSAKVVLKQMPESLLGRQSARKKSWIDTISQLWSKPAVAEARDLGVSVDKPVQVISVGPTDRDTTVFINDITSVVTDGASDSLRAGELFGEIAALSRTPRTATLVADQRCEALEIRWQGLRDIRQRSPEIKEHVDRLYRERALKAHLRGTPLFQRLSPESVEKIANATEFLSFGSFDWNVSYNRIREMNATERLQYEPLVASEGHYPNGVYLIRSGFARLSESYNHGERTVSYLGRGQVFGLNETAYNFFKGRGIPNRNTLRGVGCLDVLFIPTAIIEEYLMPHLTEADFPEFETIEAEAKARVKEPVRYQTSIDPDLLEFFVERRYVNGSATMIIDMERCTRCDDCVRACASTHNNNPRFIRHGPVQNGYMVANACMHCQDPVCMIGCPTGAIHRGSAGSQVVINDTTCIGCATCANACPYDNIQVVVARGNDGEPLRDLATKRPIEKATKCDLCVDQHTGPACVNACPHDALIRADMRDFDRLSDWLRK